MAKTGAERIEEGKLLLGVVHLKPLPGSPRSDGCGLEPVLEAARKDAENLLSAGFDGYVVENFGDFPFYGSEVPAHTVAAMTRIIAELPREGAFVATNVLRNDALGAIAIAGACDLDAVRINVHCGAKITDQGIIEGRAAETLRLRSELTCRAAILADVDVKHAAPLGTNYSILDEARDTALRGSADALIITGKATGDAASRRELDAVRDAVPGHPIFVGSGVTIETAADWYQAANGIIVGSALKPGGDTSAPIDPRLAASFAKAARGS